MTINDRITRPDYAICDIIELSEAEKENYNGCGWHIAQFQNGELVSLLNLLDVTYTEDLEKAANEILAIAILWMKAKKRGEYCLVMCSGYQLCEPVQLNIADAASVAYLGRRIGEILLEAE
jgi:hypothetical protein